MGVDLHLHSNASDGHYSPAELVHLAAKSGLTIIALTDHDSTEGITRAMEAARTISTIKVIPGVEIGTDVPHGEVHLLGYFIDYRSEELNRKLAKLRESRLTRATRMIAKLYNLGVDIEWKRVQELAGSGSVGRPHIAQAMLEKGYIASFKEAFDRYIGREGPAYVEREKMSPEEAVALVLEAGGLPVLAHPGTAPELTDLLGRLKKAGLLGLEAYYAKSPAPEITRLIQLARNFGLIVTGGSDFHGINADFEVPLGETPIPRECASDLIALAQKLGRPNNE
ncbi:MAG: PHP domain-containing protein [Chloroflexi bacterium]|nr:PHP domain-containing protein [Chloroflexota bacterium]